MTNQSSRSQNPHLRMMNHQSISIFEHVRVNIHLPLTLTVWCDTIQYWATTDDPPLTTY